ncbi:hypothetical protein PAECIP111892_01536 [Paenibacillus auburnensis]|uniref:Transcription regulator PadR N-terminal domain-containing protein n=1 Tax=Paenibacillus auburnensis TaxID=2905649 RepID=A0ABM9BV82_9BACL|nr:PadR family transcriptional regulator [Paenibacillus auburnensis]CAH1194281.1 hypothetical protein PAECIP111892_01536 [Paenibacillus auburnensis]
MQNIAAEQLTDSAYYILLALFSPKHGYAIMKYIEELTDGEVKIGPATLYTLIKKMQKTNYILLNEDEDERRLRMARHGHAAIHTLKEEGLHEERPAASEFFLCGPYAVRHGTGTLPNGQYCLFFKAEIILVIALKLERIIILSTSHAPQKRAAPKGTAL